MFTGACHVADVGMCERLSNQWCIDQVTPRPLFVKWEASLWGLIARASSNQARLRSYQEEPSAIFRLRARTWVSLVHGSQLCQHQSALGCCLDHQSLSHAVDCSSPIIPLSSSKADRCSYLLEISIP